MKKLLLGGTIAVASLMFPVKGVQAQTPVMDHCPGAGATWTVGYNIWEVIPLAPSQYRTATVINGPVNVREGIGFDSRVRFLAYSGLQVMVTGEGWDAACNQWMQVLVKNGTYWEPGWIHGDYVTP